MKTLIIVLSGIIAIAGLGCAALSSYVTPATVDQRAVKYVVQSGVADSNDYAGWQNLEKATRLLEDIDSAHAVNQWRYTKLIESDNLVYARHKDIAGTNLTIAQQREKSLFGETGLLSLGLSMAGFGTLTGVLGLLRKRPQDVTQEELKAAVAQATGQTVEELEAKNTAITEIVLGLQKFLKTYETKNPEIAEELKSCFQQTTETRALVATIKAENPA